MPTSTGMMSPILTIRPWEKVMQFWLYHASSEVTVGRVTDRVSGYDTMTWRYLDAATSESEMIIKPILAFQSLNTTLPCAVSLTKSLDLSN